MADTPNIKDYTWGIGRRKSSVARVRICPRTEEGNGNIIVNGKDYKVYFTRLDHQKIVSMPLDDANLRLKYDVWVKINGGGITGQAGSVRLGIARALIELEKDSPDIIKILKDNEHLTRDGRMKERKKYGLRGARRAYQFSKR